MDTEHPKRVTAALERARENGFSYSCEPLIGRLLATLAAAVPEGGRILELGTGVGVGTAWLVEGLGERDDTCLVTVEHDAETAALAARSDWPRWVEPRIGDAERLLPELGGFDLIFADAEGGKWSGLDLTLAALRPGGVLLVDDMELSRYERADHRAIVEGIRNTLTSDPRLVAVDAVAAGGFILATRSRSTPAADRPGAVHG